MYKDPSLIQIDAIRSHARTIVRELGFMKRGLAGTDLSPSAIHTIIEIGLGNAANATDLVLILDLEKSSVSRLLKKLTESDLIRSERSVENPRVKVLALTAKGKTLFHDVEDFARQQVTDALSRLPEAKRNLIEEGLFEYAKALDNGDVQSPQSSFPSDIEILNGYTPSLLVRVTEMHASYYGTHYGFGDVFEQKVASEMAEFLSRIAKPANRVFYARRDQKIVGSISVDSEGLGPGKAHLRWFILDDEVRGLGVGQALLEKAISHVDDMRFSETHLWTFKSLDAARHLYEKAGFVLVQEKPGQQWGYEVIEQEFCRSGR